MEEEERAWEMFQDICTLIDGTEYRCVHQFGKVEYRASTNKFVQLEIDDIRVWVDKTKDGTSKVHFDNVLVYSQTEHRYKRYCFKQRVYSYLKKWDKN